MKRMVIGRFSVFFFEKFVRRAKVECQRQESRSAPNANGRWFIICFRQVAAPGPALGEVRIGSARTRPKRFPRVSDHLRKGLRTRQLVRPAYVTTRNFDVANSLEPFV